MSSRFFPRRTHEEAVASTNKDRTFSCGMAKRSESCERSAAMLDNSERRAPMLRHWTPHGDLHEFQNTQNGASP